MVFIIKETFSEQVEKLSNVFSLNEEYLRKKRIQTFFIIQSGHRLEDHRNLVKNIFKASNKQIFFSNTNDLKDVLKDTEVFINNHVDSFYSH